MKKYGQNRLYMKIWEESCEKKKEIYNFGAIAHEVKIANWEAMNGKLKEMENKREEWVDGQLPKE